MDSIVGVWCPPGAQVDDISKHNYKMLKSRKDDAVVARLKKALDHFKELLPLLAEVRRHLGFR